jgi:mannobiose 2-epimerase
MAHRAYDYIKTYFWDRTYGGAYWLVDYKGNALEMEKKIYGQAFYIYALSEYFLAFSKLGNCAGAREQAIDLFNLVESHSHDNTFGGYFEVCNQDWSIATEGRLSEKDMAEKKSMNNHLHVVEAYTNLYRIWPDKKLKSRLEELLDLFSKHIIDAGTGHMNHFFDESWQLKSQSYTFGHDIEASWLLCEAAEVLGDMDVLSHAQDMALRLARVTMTEGLDADGGLCYEGRAGQIIDPNREWWPQAECVIGFLNAATKVWDFIIKYIVDHKHGDWFWRVDPAGRYDPKEPKVSQWKGPYHSVRMCLEAIRRLKVISELKDQ